VNESIKYSLVDEPEAARFLGISPRKLWDLRKFKGAPHARFGKRVKYDLEVLVAWYRQQASMTLPGGS
jgi:hypothetical protein